MSIIKDKVVWITGASSGIGEAIALVMAEKGAKLILSSRNESELKRVKSLLPEPTKSEAQILVLDLAKPETLEEKANEALNIHKRVDFLVHSGGISQRAFTVDTQMEVYRRIMEVNFFSTIILTKAILPFMIKNGFGHIVPISSLVGKIGSPYRSGYAASKHALHGFYDSLRAETFDQNIFVTIPTPGFIKTNVSINALTANGEALNKMDDAQINGMSAEQCAKKIIKAIEKEKNEVLIGGKETLAVYLMRFFPAIFAKIIRKAKVR